MDTPQSKLEALQTIVTVAAFRHMPPERMARLADTMVLRNYAPGQLIFLEGDSAGGLWFIIRGKVRIIKQSMNGRLQGLCLVDRGKCFGSCPLFDSDANPADAQAVDNVTLMILPRSEMSHLVHSDTQLATVLFEIYSERLAHLARLGECLGTWTATHRINDCILAYASEGEPYPEVMLTHDKLAALAGTVREVVTRHLARLEKEGVIRVEPGRIILLDKQAINHPCLSTA